MKIYLLSQYVNNGYDTYDAIVVVAESEDDAKQIAPNRRQFEDEGDYTSWVHSVEDIQVKYVGEAAENQERGVILASFNAG